MEALRNRKASRDRRNSKNKSSFHASKGGGSWRILRKLFCCLLLCGLLLFFTVIFYNCGLYQSTNHRSNALDHLSSSFGFKERVYAVVIDAGSTGSRILAFTFLQNIFDKSLKLVDELWHEVKPGLSSYKDAPAQGARSLIPLISLAKTRIPAEKWASTPIVLRATAGLRLLPIEVAEILLIEVKRVLADSKFKVYSDSVGILDGKDEGIFSWFTVNYLSDLIQSGPERTLVALDLGGGSTQITFLPTHEQTFKVVDETDLSSISLFNKDYQLFTKSYLGLGLMAARSSVLNGQGETEGLVYSPCFNPIVNISWSYNGKVYHIKGQQNKLYHEQPGINGRLSRTWPVADYEKCYQSCVDLISKQVTNKMDDIKHRDVIAFSYFFDRAAENGLIDPYNGGIASVKMFLRATKEACIIPNVDQPFACLDLTYITAFLKHGYGLEDNVTIKLYKKIQNSEISWALGLAFHVINNGI